MAKLPSTISYEFSEAEKKALSECNLESFFHRCLPLMVILGAATHYGVKSGKLQPNRKYGSLPKVFVACQIGLFLGKLLYMEECTNKLINIPSSPLGNYLWQRKLGIPFTPEELRVLQECNRESFYQRCLPLATFLGVGTFMAVKSGYLQPNVRFGAAPKVVAAIMAGYFLGKVSYQTKCAEKLMTVPESKIGAMLRSRKFGTQNTLTMEDQDLEKAVSGIPESERYSDISNKNQLDMDMDRPLISGLDDYRPNFDDVRVGDDFIPPVGSRTTTYEELRKQNREAYEQKRTKAYRGVVAPEDVPSGLRVQDHLPLDTQPTPPLNIYGDFFEK